MPNYCENDLHLRGSKADVDSVLELIGMIGDNPNFDFGNVIPYPEGFRKRDESAKGFSWGEKDLDAARIARAAHIAEYGNDSDGFNAGGYEWCCANWGTKWNAIEPAFRPYGGVCITFKTAWGPPVPVVIALAKRFPTVTIHFEYFERGMQFAGGFTCASKEDWYEDTAWEAGIVSDSWETKNYSGHRGG